MLNETLRPAWVEVNLSNLAYNLDSIRHHAGDDVTIIAVVKADAYGSGVVPTCLKLQQLGIKWLAVATLAEGIELRQAGFKDENIIVLGLQAVENTPQLVEYDLITALDSHEFAEALDRQAAATGKTAKGIIVFDTGMGRIGYRPNDPFVAEIKKMDDLEHFTYIGMFSHMANADSQDKTYAQYQIKNYQKILSDLEEAGISMGVKSFANSASIIDHPEAYHTHIRPGIVMYGHYSDDEIGKADVPIKPVKQVKAGIVKVKEIQPGECVGYGIRFKAERPSIIATCNVGYADGFPRAWSQSGRVIVNGQFAPIAGNICMDQFMIDVTDVPDTKVGDEVILMGEDGQLKITGEEIARAAGTIVHEILCGFGQRLPKVYV